MRRLPAAEFRWILSAVALVVGSSLPAQAEDRPLRGQAVSELVEMLASPRFPEREAATNELIKRPESIGKLRAAFKTARPEASQRLNHILDKLSNVWLERSLELGKSGRIDLMVDRLTVWEGPFDPARCWQGILDIGSELRARGKAVAQHKEAWFDEKNLGKTWEGYQKYQPLLLPFSRDLSLGRDDNIVAVRAHRINMKRTGYVSSLIVASGPIEARDFERSIVLSNGPLTVNDNGVAGNCGRSVVICDVDINCIDVYDSIVISRTKILTRDIRPASVVIAGATIPNPPNVSTSRLGYVKENEPRPLDFVRFFQTADAGMTVAASQGGVKVTKLHDEWPATKAALKVGDVITALDGTKIESVESFRKVLRRATGEDSATFSISRDGKLLEIPVRFTGFDELLLKRK